MCVLEWERRSFSGDKTSGSEYVPGTTSSSENDDLETKTQIISNNTELTSGEYNDTMSSHRKV